MRMMMLTCVAWTVVLGGAEAFSMPTQWSVNGHWYEFRLGDQTADAWAGEAAGLGGHLVTMTSAQEAAHVEAVRDAANATAAFVTGGYQDASAPDYSEPSGGWRWVTGEVWDYVNWGEVAGAMQPDDLPGGASVVGVRWQEDGLWADIDSGTEWGAVFEWSADCDGDGVVDYGEIQDGTHDDVNGNGIPDCCDEGVSCHPITVDDDGPADYADIQSALEAAEEGAEVLVMPGIYTSSAGEVINFPGRAVQLSSQDGADVTIIDGEGIRRGIGTSHGGSGIVVEGFTIRNCETGGGGGGILCGTGVDITFRSMRIEDNYAGGEGGGMNVGGAGTVSLIECLFVGNNAVNGGGLHCHDASMTVSGARFESNVASGSGGAIHNSDGMSLVIDNTSFCDNDAASGSDIWGGWTDAGGVMFDDCEDSCPADSHGNGDGVVAVDDLLIVIGAFGGSGPDGDVNEDGVVGVNDLLMVIDAWGPCP